MIGNGTVGFEYQFCHLPGILVLANYRALTSFSFHIMRHGEYMIEIGNMLNYSTANKLTAQLLNPVYLH